MENCIFCNIVKGEIDSAKVYEDNQVLAFLDVHPEGRGHCLVIPKNHVPDIFEINEEVMAAIAKATQQVAFTLRSALNPNGILLRQSNGKAAGQMIFHFHMHVIPVYEEVASISEKPSMEDLKKLAEQIKG